MFYSKPDPLIFPCFFVMPPKNVIKTSNSIPPENIRKPMDILRYCKKAGKFESGSPFENNLYKPEDK